MRKELFGLTVVVVIALVSGIGFVSDEMRIASLDDQMISLQKQNGQLVMYAQVARGEASQAQEKASVLATRVGALETQLGALHSERQSNTQTIFFQSENDGTRQSYLLTTPSPLSPVAHPLVVYFHSMGNGPDEVMNLPAGTELLISFLTDRNAIVASPVYRGDSWLNPAAAADVTQMIRSLKSRYAINSIIVAGVSMGGTAALIYPLLAPSDISVSGVVAAIYASDVKDLWSETKNTQVKESLRAAYGGTPTEQSRVYEERSVMRNIVHLPISMPVALYASYNDSMIPSAQQARLRDALMQRGNPLLSATIPGDHAVEDLSSGFAFVLNRTEKH